MMSKLIPRFETHRDAWAFGFGWSWYDDVEFVIGVGPFALIWTIKEER